MRRFWRNLFAGCASARFHEKHLGDSEPALQMIRSARLMTAAIDLFRCQPRNDLLSDREPNEAYCLADPGSSTRSTSRPEAAFASTWPAARAKWNCAGSTSTPPGGAGRRKEGPSEKTGLDCTRTGSVDCRPHGRPLRQSLRPSAGASGESALLHRRNQERRRLPARQVYLTGSHTWDNLRGHRPRATRRRPLISGLSRFLQRYGHNFVRLWRLGFPQSTKGSRSSGSLPYPGALATCRSRCGPRWQA